MLGTRAGQAGQPVGELAADPARRHRLPPRRDARDLALSDRRADLSRPPRHVLRAVGDGAFGRRRPRRAQRRRQRRRARLRRSQIRTGIAAGGDEHRIQLLAVRPRRQPRPRLSRPAGRPGAEPLLQRSRRVAVDLHQALGRPARRQRRRIGAGLHSGFARADRGQPGKPPAHSRQKRGEPHRRQRHPGEPDRSTRGSSASR